MSLLFAANYDEINCRISVIVYLYYISSWNMRKDNRTMSFRSCTPVALFSFFFFFFFFFFGLQTPSRLSTGLLSYRSRFESHWNSFHQGSILHSLSLSHFHRFHIQLKRSCHPSIFVRCFFSFKLQVKTTSSDVAACRCIDRR